MIPVDIIRKLSWLAHPVVTLLALAVLLGFLSLVAIMTVHYPLQSIMILIILLAVLVFRDRG